jgi:hypothetical protein
MADNAEIDGDAGIVDTLTIAHRESDGLEGPMSEGMAAALKGRDGADADPTRGSFEAKGADRPARMGIGSAYSQ